MSTFSQIPWESEDIDIRSFPQTKRVSIHEAVNGQESQLTSREGGHSAVSYPSKSPASSVRPQISTY